MTFYQILKHGSSTLCGYDIITHRAYVAVLKQAIAKFDIFPWDDQSCFWLDASTDFGAKKKEKKS